MPSVRSRLNAPSPVVFSNQDVSAPKAAPVSVIPRPASAGEFGHTLIHDLDLERRANLLAHTLRRYGEPPDTAAHNSQAQRRLEAKWRAQLSSRRRWFEAQRQSLCASQTQASLDRRAGLMLVSDADTSLEGAHDCAHHASLDEARAHKGGCSHSHHPNERSLLMVDLDEAAHGVFASVKQTLPLFKGEGVGEIEQSFAEQAAQLSQAPFEWMAQDIPSAGAGDFGAALGAATLVAPLALIAVKAGVHETRDALRIRRELTARMTRHQDQAESLSSLLPATPGATPPTLLEARHQVALQAAKDDRFAARLNRLRLGIGVSSAASGATIFIKTALDVVLKSSLVASAKKLNVVQFVADHGLAATAVTAAGVAGTLVLGPLAGAFATALGVFFARKSALRHRAFRQDRARVQGFLHTADAQQRASGRTSPAFRKYQHYIERKLGERARFYRVFKRWNFSFLGGSSLYAASALTKAALGIAALAGAGALISNPVGWGILLGVGVVGAVMMGVSSWQFLFGHPRNERYERYARDDHPDLDRHFLAGLDLMPAPADEAPWAGVELRARLFQKLDRQADALDRLKRRMATQLNKKPETRAADVVPDLLARARALASGVAVFLRTGQVREAAVSARREWSRRTPQLNEPAVADWLSSESAARAWGRFALRQLEAERRYLERKLAYRLSLHERLPDWQPQPGDSEEKYSTALAKFLSDLDAGAERDQAQLERIRLFYSSPRDPVRDDRFLLSLLSGVKPDSLDALDAPSIRRELAVTLLRDMPRRLRDTKGMLLDTEMQAGRLRASQPSAAAPQLGMKSGRE